MSSVTKSRINCRPLCTRNVCPIKSGTIVQSRDQVLIGSRCADCWRSTFANSRRSTYGPFFSDRLICFAVPEAQLLYTYPCRGPEVRTTPPLSAVPAGAAGEWLHLTACVSFGSCLPWRAHRLDCMGAAHQRFSLHR